MKRRAFLAAAALFGLMQATGQAQAAWPEKPVTYIIPFNPGGESDIAARFQQPLFEKLTGQQLIIKYQTGAGGAQAWSQLNSMPGDGYTIMGTNLPHLILQPMTASVGYQTDDITNVYWFHYTPDAILVPKSSQYKTLQDLIDYAKANPGFVTFSGSGTNTANHLAHQRFDQLAGVTTTYIPFSGTAPSVTAAIGGQVTATMGYSTVAMQQKDNLRMLAVATEKRMDAFPDVPTFKELGLAMVGGAYRGVAVPKSTPEPLRKAVSDTIGKINHEPALRKEMQDAGFVVIDVPYGEVPAFMAKRKEEVTAVAKKMGFAAK